jgi:hypothetical protein
MVKNCTKAELCFDLFAPCFLTHFKICIWIWTVARHINIRKLFKILLFFAKNYVDFDVDNNARI